MKNRNGFITPLFAAFIMSSLALMIVANVSIKAQLHDLGVNDSTSSTVQVILVKSEPQFTSVDSIMVGD